MKKNNKAKKDQKPRDRVPRQPEGVTELNDQDLERVQGGRGKRNPGDQSRG